MKKTFLFLSLLLMVVTSCKKNTVDVTDLLSTVPSSAGGVVVINLEGLIEDTGSKIKDHQIKPSKELEECVANMKSSAQENLKVLFEGASGVDPKAAVIFYDSNRAFLTLSLYDEEKFCHYVEKETGEGFAVESGVKVCGNIAVKDSQAWVCLTSGKKIDADAISSYAGLKDSQSFLVTKIGEKLLTEENDIRGWVLLGAYLDQMLSRSQRAMFTLGAGFVFEDAESIEFKIDFKKGEFEAEAVILNDKFKPAKYLLPADKVDIATLKDLGETCDGMMAFTLNSELIKKFEKLGSSFGGALFGNLSETFKNIDGTIGVVAKGKEEAVNGVITTKGEVSQELKNILSENLGTVSQDGKLLRFSKGTVSGKLSVADCADALKGCCLGIVADASSYDNIGLGSNAPKGFSMYVIKLKPESGGLEVEVEANTSDRNENALVAILRSLSK